MLNILEKQSIVYPMSLNYVKDWGSWEVVRELVSNAIDTNSEYAIFQDGKDLVIADNGSGLQIKQLLFGVSEKQDSNAIGQFGEGLKLALLVLTRMGKKALIKSGELRIENDSSWIDGEQVLKLNYWYENKINGTEIIINNWEESTFEENFLKSCDDRIVIENEKGKILNINKLFVKGVFITDLSDYMLGYDLPNIPLNRDRKGVSNWDLDRFVGYVWSKIEDPDLWEVFFMMYDKNCKDTRCYINDFSTTKESEMAIAEGFYKAFGKNAVLVTGENSEREARHRGSKPIRINAINNRELFEKLIKTDEKFIFEKMGSKAGSVKQSELTDEQKQNWKKIVKIARLLGYENELTIAKLEDANGRYVPSINVIQISPERLYDIENGLSTLIHEIAHAKFGTQDCTDAHVNACTLLAAKLGRVILKV